jgi:hypothetical protein
MRRILLSAALIVLGIAAPAHADGPAVHGYVLATQPNTGMCTVSSWGAPFNGPDLYIYVRCFNSAGVLADSKFIAYFTNRTVAEGGFSYLWADHSTGGPYDANAAYSYDSTGDQITFTQNDVGVYTVYFPALLEHDGTPELADGHLQVTAYNSLAIRCTAGIDDDENPTAVSVVCRNAAGDPVNTRFVASYSFEVSHLRVRGQVPVTWGAEGQCPRQCAVSTR